MGKPPGFNVFNTKIGFTPRYYRNRGHHFSCDGNRIWVLSRKSVILVAILSAGCLTTLGLDIAMSIQISKVLASIWL
ncbi:hypothetical protein BDQ17DRAFT_1350268 [Cyathus striatus]|nr:hypothetical protein BDQ17DRAFT_1350268 [Cyathus striatus]